MHKIIAIIPARSGSKAVGHKNIKLLNNKPLMYYTIKAALESRIFDEVMVSTDSVDYATIARASGANVPFLRSAENARDESKNIDVVLEVLENYAKLDRFFDAVCVLQPTSPFREACDILGALELFKTKDQRGVVSIHEVDDHPILIRQMQDHVLKNLLNSQSTLRRQDFPPFYKVNGAIYINKTSDLTKDTSLNDNPIGYVMSHFNSIDIDTLFDFEIAQSLIKIRQG
ncbi:MAG: acylneuraminate cytidylyltransferase family protein [Helicobacter sp.]|nr:acylneuraminate cytidylyltransferase family protein [Helicobacter sp.]